MTDYPYVPSYWDNYGRRKATLGLMLHMAEGTGTVGYLDKNGRIPPRGVSVHFVCETTGRMVRMLPLDDSSGSLNPNDRSTDKPYFGHSHLVDVLGDYWRDPNVAVISVEIEGFARTGPNGRQQAALVDWAADMVSRYPTIRGALGHADQTNTKACPGATAAMRSVFASIGGHGLWTPEEDVASRPFSIAEVRGTFTVTGSGHDFINPFDDRDGTRVVDVPDGLRKYVVGQTFFEQPLDDHPGDRQTGYLVSHKGPDGKGRAYVAMAADGTFEAEASCSDQIAAQREKDRTASLAAIEEVYAA